MTETKRYVQPSDVESQVFDWGILKWMCTPEVTGAQNVSAGIVEVTPGTGHDIHKHPESEEILYVVRGEGEQTVAGETRTISSGDVVHIPADVEHGTINTGWETMTVLAIYSPPGPEKQLRDHPDATIVPAGEFPTVDQDD